MTIHRINQHSIAIEVLKVKSDIVPHIRKEILELKKPTYNSSYPLQALKCKDKYLKLWLSIVKILSF